MNKLLGIRAVPLGTVLIATFACFVSQGRSANAPLPKSARVTQIIQDVKLLPSNAAPRPAAVNDDVREGTAVRTGSDSRTELTFADLTLTRLGANSVFSFNPGDRTFELGQGAILMSVPPNGSSVKVKTAAVTAAITGGTAIFGAGPPPKFMVLEGIGTFYPTGHPELAITLHGGEMVTLLDGKLVKQEFNVKLVLESSELIVPFDDLPNLALIWAIVFEQEGDGTQPANHQYDDIDERDQSVAASQGAPGGSGKFGTPSTIGSPVPYQINSTTEIVTDPTITTNGVTDQGKIYRGVADDGPPAEWFFGSTTAFDTASGFDQIIGGAIDLPVAVFKFQSLQLTGDPTISVGDGAPVDLALISIDDMSSGGPGGPLTFAGISHLLLATQAGSIDLGSEISFENIGHVIFYARGAGSNLTLASPISGGALVHLYAEGTVQINGDISVTNDFTSFSGGDFQNPNAVITATIVSIQSFSNITLDGEDIPDVSGGTLNLDATDTLTINVSGGTVDRSAVTLQGGTINLNSPGVVTLDFSLADAIFTAGLGGFNAPNVDLAGRNMTLTSLGNIDIRSLFLDEATRTITVTAGNLLTVAGSFSISLDKSNLGDGGNIVVGSGSDFTADEVTLEIFASAPSGAGGNITVNVGGSMDTGAVSLLGSFATENPQGPGENVTLQVTQDLTVSGGKDDAGINLTVITPVNQTLTSGANVTLDVGGNVMTATFGGISLFINNNINEVVTGANITATIGGTLTTGEVSAVISNQSGEIGTGGNITFHVGGALTASGDTTFQLFNNGGTIGSGGLIDVLANSLSITGSLIGYIDNSGGSIGGGGGGVEIESVGGITVGGNLHVLGEVIAGSNITAGTVSTSVISAPSGILSETTGGIHPFIESFSGGADLQHTFTVMSIVSPNGIDFSGDQFGFGAPGGILTINADNLTFEQTGGVAFANFNGADQFFFGGGPPAGSGGTFVVNADNNIVANYGADITATTGLVYVGGFQGDGGSVTLRSTGGTVTVNNTIEVSSDHSKGKGQRQSASGGDITLQSDLESGLGITVGPTAQLLSELNESAPGPGGTILLSTMGANITVAPGAVIQADFGTITMDQNDPPGAFISIEGATLISETLNIDAGWDLNIGLTTPAVLDAVSIWLNALNDLNWSGQTSHKTAVDSDGNVTLTAGNNLSILSGADISRLSGGRPNGVNISLSAGNNLITNGGLTLHTEPGDLTNGGNISLIAGASVPGGSITAQNGATGQTINASVRVADDMGTGANIELDADGSITAGSISGSVDLGALTGFTNGTNGFSISPTLSTGGNIDVDAGVDLSVVGGTGLDLFVNTGFGTITTGGEITLTLGNDFVTDAIALLQIFNGSGSIGTGGNLTLDIGGDLTAPNGIELNVLSGGGDIGTGGNIDFTVDGAVTAQHLQLYLDSIGGEIDTGGDLNLLIGGALALDGPLGLEVDNYDGGTITAGGNVMAHFVGDVTNTTGDFHSFNFYVINGGNPFVAPLAGGTIGTGGNINVTFDGDALTTPTLTTGGFAAQIWNDSGDIGTGGNIFLEIGGNQTSNVLFVYITNRVGGHIGDGGNITFDVTGSVTTTNNAVFEILNHGGTIDSDPVVYVHAGSFNIGGVLLANIDNTGGGSIGGTGGSLSLDSDGAITVTQGMWVLGAVTAGGDVTAQTMASTDVTVTSAIGAIHAGTGGITRFRFLDGDNSTADVLHTLTAPSVTSAGGINFDGTNADGDFSMATNAGDLTINANSLSFGPGVSFLNQVNGGLGGGADIVGPVTFNGGDGSGVPGFGAGNGGTFTVNTTGDITVSSDIEATTGAQPQATPPEGSGGTVSLNSSAGTVTVNNRIEVSSAEPESTVAPTRRRSAQGGNINMTSGKATGVAINVTSSAQLLSLLDAAAPGPGGKITIVATGASSSIDIDNANASPDAIAADRGEVEIRHDGADGTVNINNANIRGDIVKVGALGANGVLNIGSSNAGISADNVLKLYALSSNGQLNFTGNVTLSSGSGIYLAAGTITIGESVPGVGYVVTINGVGGAANVYTNTANYTGFGGNGSSAGTFDGNGASTPQPLASAPPFTGP